MIISLSGCQYVCAFADPTDSLTRPWHVYLFILSMPIYTHSPLSKHIYTRTRQKNSVSPYYHCVHLSMHTHNTVCTVQNVCIVLLEYAGSCLEVSQLLYDGMYIQDGALVVPQHLQ